MIRLYNVTESELERTGTTEYLAQTSGYAMTASVLKAYLDLASQTDFRIEHHVDATKATDGFGVAAGIMSTPETYTMVDIIKIG